MVVRSSYGGSSGSRQARSVAAHRRPPADDEATQRLLNSILLSKMVGEDPLAAEATGSTSPPAGIAESSEPNSPVSPKDRTNSGSTSVEVPFEMSLMQLELERQEFVNKVCTASTRFDVRDWISKIFDMNYKASMEQAQRDVKEKRRRRLRSSTAVSESGASGYTSQTGTTGTALQTVGGSIAQSYKPPRSVESFESLVAHHGGVEGPLSLKERIQAFIQGRIPELNAHVNEHVAAKTEVLQRKVDDDLATVYLRETLNRKVFDGRANYLRWQNARHQLFQKELDACMPRWILEATESWNQKKAMEGKKKQFSDTDLVFEYLTKRAAHIDSGKLPTEIPLFKTLHSSYSLPSMWKDKYHVN